MGEAAYTVWLNAIPTAAFLLQDGQITFANNAAAELTGFAQTELAALQALVPEVPPHAARIDGWLTTRTGRVPVELSSTEIAYEGQTYHLITATPNLARAALENKDDSLFLLLAGRDGTGQIVDFYGIDANRRGLKLMQIERDQFVGKSLSDLLPPEQARPMIARLAQVMQTGKPDRYEGSGGEGLGETDWFEARLMPLGDYMAVFSEDVSQRKYSEEAVRVLASEVEQQVRTLDEILSTTPDAFILFDRAGRYLYVNRRGLTDAGLSADQVTGKTWRELGFPEEVGLVFDQRLEHVFTTGESVTYEEQFPTLNGLRDFLTTLTPIHDGDGNVVLMLNTIRDVTELKRTAAERSQLSKVLEQQALFFNEMLSVTPDMFLMFATDHTITYASPSALQRLGRSSLETIDKAWRELGFATRGGLTFDEVLDSVIQSGEQVIYDTLMPTADGPRDFESIFSPAHDQTGAVSGVVVTNRDITERRIAEEALRESQRLFTSIFETALAGIAVYDEAGRILQVNRVYCEIYGYTPAELIGQLFTIVLPPDRHDEAFAMHQAFVNGLERSFPQTWDVIDKGGRPITVLSYNNLLVREDGERLRVAVILDVTEQKRAEQALVESEQRLTSILDSMQDVVWSVKIDTYEPLFVNPAIAALSGYSSGDFMQTPHLLTDIAHPDDLARLMTQLSQVREGARIDTEYRIIRRGGAVRWVHNRFWLVHDAQGNPQRIDGIMTDITDHKEALEHAMQIAIERERVHILSDFVRDASHEFRTPLSVINTRLYLIEKVDAPKKKSEYIASIKEQTMRILKLVESLITMSRLDSSDDAKFKQLDLNRLITAINMNTEAAAMLKGIVFTLSLSSEPLYVRGELSELMTAFNAIFDNAVNFTPPGGKISVRSYCPNEDEVAVEVQDTGFGISSEEKPHIFERFYRSDRARTTRGFGLGLPIARKIIEMHNGRIEVESVLDEGSTFRLIFPSDKRTMVKDET